MSITLPAWIAVPLIQAGQINLIEAAPFVLLSLVGLYVAGRFFWSVQEEKGRGFTLPKPPTQQDDEQGQPASQKATESHEPMLFPEASAPMS
jgi:hypothetical protein